jgi:hypothetical protein
MEFSEVKMGIKKNNSRAKLATKEGFKEKTGGRRLAKKPSAR